MTTRASARDDLTNSYVDATRTAWLTSRMSTYAKRATWIQVPPKSTVPTLSNSETLTLFRRPLHTDSHLHTRGKTSCCSSPKHKFCDPQGTQMYVCNREGLKTRTRDDTTRTTQVLLSVAGTNTSREVLAFDDSKQRIDLIACKVPQSINSGCTRLPSQSDAPDGRVEKLATDTSVVHPCPGPTCNSTLSLADAKKDGGAAEIASYSEKRKYTDVREKKKIVFLPGCNF